MDTTDPIPRRRLSDLLAERLLARIAAGDPPPGEALPSEAELAQRHGVGRPTVREALQKLDTLGVIRIGHGAPARVAVPSAERLLQTLAAPALHLLQSAPENLAHLQDARLMLEEALVGRFLANQAPLGPVTAALERQRDAIASGEGFYAADMDFHAAIADGAGNPLLPLLLRAILGWLGTFHVSAVRLPGLEPLALAEHEAIHAALAQGNATAATQAMRDHLLRSSSQYGHHRRTGRSG